LARFLEVVGNALAREWLESRTRKTLPGRADNSG
jgi:hypothetical protein